MLKTKRGAQVWLITQPAHAALAGQMAAHWGNGQFTAPGFFGASHDPERVRREVTLGIAEHDNGWWEWEADPALSEDGLPQGLDEAASDSGGGMARWRAGITRFSERHPYASFLIGDHADWLHAAQFDPDHPPELTHHLQRGRTFYPDALKASARRFQMDIQVLKEELRRRIRDDECWRAALQPEQRYPHSRLLQTLDALSLALCSAHIAPVEGRARGLGEDRVVFDDVPRRGWEDRVSIEATPVEDGCISLDPYPFRDAPFTVTVPARLVEPHTWWRAAPQVSKAFTFQRKPLA